MRRIVIDSHCDTALKLINGNTINDVNNQFTLSNALIWDKYLQFFAMYMEPEYATLGPYELCQRLLYSIKNEVKMNSQHMQIITNAEELECYFNEIDNKLGVILSVEDASCLEGKIENLQKLYDNGVRVIGLTWNGKNEVAAGVRYSNTDEDGLTKFGEEVIKKMNELDVIIDVSHLSEKSFYDVVKITTKPVIASHSCAKAICNHARNLTDNQIKIISERGGVIGVNFYKDFLHEDRSKADIDSLIKHIKHIYKIGGKECIAIGSDYDGMKREDTAIGLEDNSKLVNIIDALKKENFTDEDIDRIMWKNQYEFLKKELK